MVETNDRMDRAADGHPRAADRRRPMKRTATLATAAARKATRRRRHRTAADLELIICGTITPEMVFPSTACFVAAALGLTSTPAFDLAAACSGFIYTLETGRHFIKTGRYATCWCIGAETLSRITDYTRSRQAAFSSATGPGRWCCSDQRYPPWLDLQRPARRRPWLGNAALHRPAAGIRIGEAMLADRQQFMKIKGREVYKFAVQRFEELIEDAMRNCELTPDEVEADRAAPGRISGSSTRRWKSWVCRMEKAFVNIDKYGNTSAASIPIALDEACRAGRICRRRRGDFRRVRRRADLGQRGASASDPLQHAHSKTISFSVPAKAHQSSAWARIFAESSPSAARSFRHRPSSVFGCGLDHDRSASRPGRSAEPDRHQPAGDLRHRRRQLSRREPA